MKNCVYCGKEILTESREHVIQNALGGLYESTSICCGDCNNLISTIIDKDFTQIFNGIINNIPDMVKTNNKKSKPMCMGKAICDGKLYDVGIKDGKVVHCPQYSQEKRQNINSNEFKIIGYDFPIDNKSFRNGICKIAFNYAIDTGIDPELLLRAVNVKKDDKGKVCDINFRYRMIPFAPLNSIDKYIELDTEMELYHNLILFTQGNFLWCYVDLFNTFQYYVLLSDEWNNKPIHNDYLQLLQKLDREIPDIYIRKPKDILIYAMFYKVKPTLDVEEFKRNVSEAIRNSSNKIEMHDKIEEKFSGYLASMYEKLGGNRELMREPFENVALYFDENDRLRTEQFRTSVVTDSLAMSIASYPLTLGEFLKTNSEYIKEYTFAKFRRLNSFLIALHDNN